ncbi:LacI family transcriptional regulator, partial [Streptomyces sp. NPDC001356]
AVTMGALAAGLLLEETEQGEGEGKGRRAHEHRRVVLQPELVVRRSSLAAR